MHKQLVAAVCQAIARAWQVTVHSKWLAQLALIRARVVNTQFHLLLSRHHHLGLGEPQLAAQAAAAKGGATCCATAVRHNCAADRLQQTTCKFAGVLVVAARPYTMTIPAALYRLQVKIQALAFSPDEQRLASLGGQDDNSLVRIMLSR